MPRRADISSILIIGAGPIGIGQAVVFDYSGTPAATMPRRLLIFSALLLLAVPLHAAACSPAPPTDPRAARTAQLEEMTKRCDVPAGTLAQLGPEEVTIAAGPDVEWRKVECLIDEIKKAKPKLQYMFIGNARYETENQQ